LTKLMVIESCATAGAMPNVDDRLKVAAVAIASISFGAYACCLWGRRFGGDFTSSLDSKWGQIQVVNLSWFSPSLYDMHTTAS
jgi:hypothetical protein